MKQINLTAILYWVHEQAFARVSYATYIALKFSLRNDLSSW